MRTIEKVSASTLLALAACGSMVAVFRTITSVKILFKAVYLDPGLRPTYYNEVNYAFNLATLESGLGITAASLACCRLLFRRAASQCRSLLSRSTTVDSIEDTPKDLEKSPQVRVHRVEHRSKIRRFGILPTVPEYTVPLDTIDPIEVMFQGKLGVLPTVPGDTVDLMSVIPAKSTRSYVTPP